MYKVYLMERKKKGRSFYIKNSFTITPSAAIAETAFWELRNNSQYDDKNFILLMTKNKKKLNVHLFSSTEGGDSYFPLNRKLVF